LIKKSLSDNLRYIHTKLLRRIHLKSPAWVECSRLQLLVLRLWTLCKILRKPEFIERMLKAFKKCKDEIPVLSPLTHP